MEMDRGEFAAVMGPSGSGKTTLLNIVSGFLSADSGQVKVGAVDMLHTDKEKQAEIRSGILGFIFQDFMLIDGLTVQENIFLPQIIAKKPAADMEGKTRDLLCAFGIEDISGKYPVELSGGQKQRVAIARALATNPKILLCDEATSALDPTTTKAILNLLKEINVKYGITIVIITHEMSVVQEICSHVAIIDEGTLAETGTVEEVFQRPKSKAAKKLVFQGERDQREEMKGKRCIRIVFTSNSSFEPVIANMVLACNTPVNILLADTRDIGGVAHGQMILQLPEDEEAAEKMIQYLKNRKLEVEELDNYVG